MKRVLYAVSTYYHSLISCVKQLCYHESADILVTDYIPKGKCLAQKIQCGKIFEKVFYVGQIEEYTAVNKLDYIMNYHRKNANLIEQQLPLSFKSYDEINVFHDDIWVSHYLKDKQIKYHLIEDALDSFQVIDKTPFSYMIPKNRIKALVKRFFRIGYVYCGFDNCTLSVEVNNASGLEFLHISKKLKECSREQLMNSLDESAVNIIRNIFVENENVSFCPDDSALLLTQALMEYRLVSDLQGQINAYKRLVSEFVPAEENLVIKPHPRDEADYSLAFPNAIILDRYMPIEALMLGTKTQFKLAIMFSVSTISRTKFAKRMIVRDFE